MADIPPETEEERRERERFERELKERERRGRDSRPPTGFDKHDHFSCLGIFRNHFFGHFEKLDFGNHIPSIFPSLPTKVGQGPVNHNLRQACLDLGSSGRIRSQGGGYLGYLLLCGYLGYLHL